MRTSFQLAVSAVLLASGMAAQNRQEGLPELPPPELYRSEELQHAARANVIAILGGTLVDGTGSPPVDESAIVIRGNRIVKVGKEGEIAIPPDAMRIRADGETVLPGLIDMHVHLNQGHDLHLFLAAGVTTVRDVGNFTSQIVPLERETRSQEIIGPRIFFSGESFVHQYGFSPWQRPTRDVTEAREEVRKRIASGASVIKIVNDITPELVQTIVDEAHRSRIPVTADILGNRLVTAERAISLGVDGLEHVSGVPQAIVVDHSPLEFSEPISFKALFGWLYADSRKETALIDSIVKRGTYVVPTLSVLETQSGIPAPNEPATDAMSDGLRSLWNWMRGLPDNTEADLAFLTHFIYSQQFVAKLSRAGGHIVAGTDTPSPGLVPGFSLHRELELLVQAGLSPMQALQAATKTAAEFLGKSGELGTLEVGKIADLIIVDGAPHVRISDIRRVQTVLTGGTVFSASELLSLSRRR
ncbi:MAG: amidohydrolase family protein [Acidobacteriia bacterium]|nr:amidohydrolase family protein [Terriglobia bacterium]